MKRFWLTLALALTLVMPIVAQTGPDTLQSVQSASRLFKLQLDSGQSNVTWTGLGLVSGDMVDMDITNNSNQEIVVVLVPGMVLEDPGKSVQPVMLEDKISFTLQPGETIKRRLRGYCLDYSKDPPASGSKEDYEVSQTPEDYDRAIEVLHRGLLLEKEEKLKPVLRPLVHRTVVIQRAIWAVMGGENPNSSEELTQDLEEEIRYRSSIFPQGQLDCLSERIWSDVMKVMAK